MSYVGYTLFLFQMNKNAHCLLFLSLYRLCQPLMQQNLQSSATHILLCCFKKSVENVDKFPRNYLRKFPFVRSIVKGCTFHKHITEFIVKFFTGIFRSFQDITLKTL